jgi:hypothetical protein
MMAKTAIVGDKPKQLGRPSVITDAMELEICEWITTGKGLVKWCKTNNVHYSTVMRAIEARQSFRDRYVRAHIDKADYLADEMVSIADDGTNDTYMGEDGTERTNHDVIARSKLRIDTRKWIAAKGQPKKYGDKLDVTSDGEKLQLAPIMMPALDKGDD